MIYIGLYNKLVVLRETSIGLFLGDTEGTQDVLLPNKYVPQGTKVGDWLEVFVYTDSKNRIIATTLTPKIKLNEFALLQVKDTTPFGAFVDWGLEKDLLVPLGEQKEKMRIGGRYFVYLFLDAQTKRLAATSKLKSHFIKTPTVIEGEEVGLLVYRETELGFEVIINHRHLGLLYKNEIYKPLKLGQQLRGYIKCLRDDGKIDVSLQKQGYEQIETSQQILLDYLNSHEGFIPLTDASSPEEIKNTLAMSKKNFKKAIGALYKQKLIEIHDKEIRLLQ